MKSVAPEFAQHWQAGQGNNDGFGRALDDDALSPSQQAALEALAERVMAARSTV